MSEELNKELENEVTEEVKEAAPMETMEGRGGEMGPVRSDDGGQDRCQG